MVVGGAGCMSAAVLEAAKAPLATCSTAELLQLLHLTEKGHFSLSSPEQHYLHVCWRYHQLVASNWTQPPA